MPATGDIRPCLQIIAVRGAVSKFALVEAEQADAERGPTDEVAVDAPVHREQAHVAALQAHRHH